MLLDDDHSAAFAIRIGLLHTLLERIAHHGHIFQENILVVETAHDHILHLISTVELAIDTHGVCFGTHIHDTEGDIAVFSAKDLCDGFNGEIVTLQFVRIAIDLDLTLRSTGNGHRTHAADTAQG